MRSLGVWMVMCVGSALAGCSASTLGPADALKSIYLTASCAPATNSSEDDAPAEPESECGHDFMALVDADEQATSPGGALASDEPQEMSDAGAAGPARMPAPPPAADHRIARRAQYATAPGPEEVTRPPRFQEEFKVGIAESDLNRIARRLRDVPLDIRPTQGDMPAEDLTRPSAAEMKPDRWIGCEDQDPIVCSWTPWTICFRPLYFEEIALERYGVSWGIVQPAISGAHFFGGVLSLPYKMWVRCPRSCVCSNGFSRCGDLPPPDYNDCVWRWDAAAFEAGIVAGIIIALP